MIEGRLIPLGDDAAWTLALQGIPHAFAHTHGHCVAFALSSSWPVSLAAFEGRAACPIAVRTFEGEPDAFTPYGLGGFAAVGPVQGLGAAWRRLAAKEGWVCAYLRSNPVLHDPLLDEEAGQATQEVYVLDLHLPESELMSGMSQGRRRELRSMEAKYEIGLAAQAGIDFLVSEAPDFFASRGAAGVYQFSEATWRALAAAPGVLMLEARRAGRIEAVSLFGQAGVLGDFLFNVSTAEGQAASAALIWDGARRLKAAGCTVLNLGGGIAPGDSLAEFKRRFGARRAPMKEMRHVFQPDVFARLLRSAGAAADSGYFPPYHARRG
jgi:hypothetical protein